MHLTKMFANNKVNQKTIIKLSYRKLNCISHSLRRLRYRQIMDILLVTDILRSFA